MTARHGPPGAGFPPDESASRSSAQPRGSATHTNERDTPCARSSSALAALAAVATPLIATAGSANAATTDANGGITVAKGEVMAQFPGMNESAFQWIAMAPGESLTGSNVFTATTTTGVGCSDGTVQNHVRNTVITSPIAATEVFNGSANKVTGRTLGAKGASVITENNTYGTSPSGRFPNYATICAGHWSVTSYVARLVQSHSDVTSFQFNCTGVQRRGQPVRGPDRLIHRTTVAPPARKGRARASALGSDQQLRRCPGAAPRAAPPQRHQRLRRDTMNNVQPDQQGAGPDHDGFGAVLMLAACLPWVSFGGIISVNGLAGDGKITLTTGLILAIICTLTSSSPRSRARRPSASSAACSGWSPSA